jgi:dienelactone hydrolase
MFILRKPWCSLGAVCIAAYFLSSPLAAEEPFRVLSPASSGRHPAVLLVPGCSGFVATNGVNVYEERANQLREAGYAVVFVDYLGRRMQGNCAHVLQAEVSADVLEAASWIRDQPGIDAGRIAVIGWSYGGGGVLAALKAMPLDPPIAKAVMYYPVCRGAVPWTSNVVGLMLLGENDDIALPGLCDSVAKGVPAGRLRTITYANARHGFDMRGLAGLKDQPPGSPGYNAEAARSSWSTVLDFLR